MWIIVAIVQTVVVYVIIWAMVSFGIYWIMIYAILALVLIAFLMASAINGGLKGIAATLVSFVLGFVLFNYYFGYRCGPDPEDVKVMKPMAKAISDYIVKHGIPKSLSEIPGLPYAMHREKDNSGFYYFKVSNNKYIVYQKAKNMLEFQSKTKRGNGYTWLWLIYKIDKQGHCSLLRKEYFLAHRNGICSSMKQ